MPPQSFPGLKIVIDCANGATYKVAPTLLREMRTKLTALNVNPDGQNINLNCGALYPENLAKKVQESFPYYKLLGMDIAVTKKDPVIIEINAFPDIIFQEQTSGPLLKEHRNFIEFKKHNLLINKFQKNLFKKTLGLK